NFLIKFPLFFILKRGRKLRPIIDYKELNEIIKKKLLFLLLITKLRDLLYRAN
ncbi:hypothetical protein CCUS01_04929, partial [Colletotrichum cuscutae]